MKSLKFVFALFCVLGGAMLGQPQPAEANSPSGNPCAACRDRVMAPCCQRMTNDPNCANNSAAIGACGREASAQCHCG